MQRYANNATWTYTKKVMEQSNDVIQHEVNLHCRKMTIKKIAVVCDPSMI